MSQFVFRCLVMASSALSATALAQQSAPLPPPSLVLDGAPSSVYRSAWSGYRPFADEKVISWREANDEVRRIGGWRAYLRESQEGQSSAKPSAASKDSGTPAPSDAGAAQGHDAHKKPKEPR